MCGITGWVDFTPHAAPRRGDLQAMTDTLACRGPDAEGTWLDDQVALGHRRLAVIDIEGGRQPMTAHADGRPVAALSFCGEVYNYRELRTELRGHGHRFDTASDTEVVLRALQQWGRRAPERFEGMFALAYWDVRARQLLLVRDRMGVKPLYYQRTDRGVIFGSEQKAVLAHPAGSRRVDLDGLREALDMVKTPELTAFADLREVRPGTLLTVSATGTQSHRYWSLQAEDHPDDRPATIRHVRELLEDIVEHQLVADVPICTLLSGGLDSSAVTALAAQRLAATGGDPVRSFAVDFVAAAEGFEPDAVRGAADAPFARELAAHIGGVHREILLDSARLVDPAVRAAVLRAVDQPPAFWGDMWPSLFLLFREVRRHATVAVSGEAADELFGGYQWFHNPAAVRAETFPWLTGGSSRYFGGLGLLDAELRRRLDVDAYRRARYADAMREVPVLPGENEVERRMRELTYLNLTRFVQTLLDRKDRMSMAASLEVRVPFCDHRLVQYVFNAPWGSKFFDGREKSLLRAATADLLPTSIVTRRKTPYPATQDPSYEAMLRTALAHLVDEGTSPVLPLLDHAKVRDYLQRAPRAVSRPYDRGSVELALWLHAWLEAYDPKLEF